MRLHEHLAVLQKDCRVIRLIAYHSAVQRFTICNLRSNAQGTSDRTSL